MELPRVAGYSSLELRLASEAPRHGCNVLELANGRFGHPHHVGLPHLGPRICLIYYRGGQETLFGALRPGPVARGVLPALAAQLSSGPARQPLSHRMAGALRRPVLGVFSLPRLVPPGPQAAEAAAGVPAAAHR